MFRWILGAWTENRSEAFAVKTGQQIHTVESRFRPRSRRFSMGSMSGRQRLNSAIEIWYFGAGRAWRDQIRHECGLTYRLCVQFIGEIDDQLLLEQGFELWCP